MTATTEFSESESEAITSSAASSADETESGDPQCIKKKIKCQKQVAQGGRSKCKNKGNKEQMRSKPKKAKRQKVRERQEQHLESAASETESASASEDASAPSSEPETTEEEASSAAATSTENEEDLSKASGWSLSEDAILCSMRRGGENWAEIVESLGRPKAVLKARLKMLAKEAETERAKQIQGKKERRKIGGGKKNKKGCEKKQRKKKAKKKPCTSEESEDSPEEEEDDDEEIHEPDTESSQESSEATVNPASVSDEGSEYRLQQVYLNKCIRAELYPQRINLEPDNALTQIDCEILTSIDAQRHQTRWLAVQANFYNMTGRMLPLEVIRQRCEAAEWEAMRQRLDAQGDGHLAEKVESWIQGVYA